ncbi:MAG TPA: DUF4157 domain-containing protein, partial [Bacteroidia bacterium]|nr:DUF4157 domain-containing protein [Bacteroidia bacterium]
MYAPRQYRPEKKKPFSNFLALEQPEHEGPIMAPPLYSEIEQTSKSEDEETKETQKNSTPEGQSATEQNAVQNKKQQDSEAGESESETETASSTIQKKSAGRSENPPQFKLKAGAPFQFKFANAPVQMKSGNGGGGSSEGSGVPTDVMGKMESTFNADFSNVQIVQNSSKASEAGALAYAQGNSVHFAPGQFNPETPGGQQLLGHELSHVVQQRQGRVQANSEVNGMPVNNDRSLEAEADQMGAKAAQMKVDTPSTPKAPSTGGASTAAPKQLKADPNANPAGKSEKEKKEVQEEGTGQVFNADSTLALDGFATREDETKKEGSEGESKGNGEVQSLDEKGGSNLGENPNEPTQVPSDLTQVAPVGDDTTQDGELEEEAPEVEAEEKQAEPEQEEGAEEESKEAEGEGENGKAEGKADKKGGGKNGADGQKGKNGGQGEGGNGQGKGGNAAGGGGNAETAAPIEHKEAVMGDFGASEPNPQLAVMPMDLAKGLAPEQIVQDNGDGSVIVKGVDAESEGPEEQSVESAAPIQMAPDPDKPKKKKTKPVQKVPEDVTNQIFAKKQADAKVLVDGFKAENEAKVQTLKNLATTIAPAIEAKATEAKGVVETSVGTNRQAIADDILVKQDAARAEALRMDGVIQAQYDTVLSKIKDKTTTEKDRIKKAYDDSEKTISELETAAIKSATDAF